MVKESVDFFGLLFFGAIIVNVSVFANVRRIN